MVNTIRKWYWSNYLRLLILIGTFRQRDGFVRTFNLPAPEIAGCQKGSDTRRPKPGTRPGGVGLSIALNAKKFRGVRRT
jgi:hypothetical protein